MKKTCEKTFKFIACKELEDDPDRRFWIDVIDLYRETTVSISYGRTLREAKSNAIDAMNSYIDEINNINKTNNISSKKSLRYIDPDLDDTLDTKCKIDPEAYRPDLDHL